jgi:NitT/TauT family transport system ATP-binding protein
VSQDEGSSGIVLQRVGKSFPRAEAPTIADFSLHVRPGEFVSILGPSGCGKTTLLRLVDGLLLPDAGTVRVQGQAPQPGRRIGFVFQSFRLIPWKTALDNVAFPLELAGTGRAERTAMARQWLDRVGLGRYADSYPSQLSGGMKQRVALARALAGEPDTLLLDEPFASLDAQTREIMQLELLRLWEERQLTALFVTHSVEEAVLLADRVVVMGPAPQSLRQIVSVDLPRPRRDAVRSSARFMELRTALTATIRDLITSDPRSPFFQRG